MTPYSALAGGRLSKHPGETSKRLEEDSYARFKYDATAKQDQRIIDRVAELAGKHGVSMTEISLAWLLTKVTAPVGRRHKAASYRRRGKGRGTGAYGCRDRLSGRTLCAPQIGWGHGSKYSPGSQGAARVEYRQSRNTYGSCIKALDIES